MRVVNGYTNRVSKCIVIDLCYITGKVNTARDVVSRPRCSQLSRPKNAVMVLVVVLVSNSEVLFFVCCWSFTFGTVNSKLADYRMRGFI